MIKSTGECKMGAKAKVGKFRLKKFRQRSRRNYSDF